MTLGRRDVAWATIYFIENTCRVRRDLFRKEGQCAQAVFTMLEAMRLGKVKP